MVFLREWGIHAGLKFLADSRPVIRNDMGYNKAVGIFTADVIAPCYGAAGLRVFDGIVQEVDDDLLNLARVDLRIAVGCCAVKMRYESNVFCLSLGPDDGDLPPKNWSA